jgi:hypothetical protein
MSKSSPATSTTRAVKEANAKLRQFYASGKTFLKARPKRASYGSMAELSGTSQYEARQKARQFATRATRQDLKELCDLCEAERHPLGTSLVKNALRLGKQNLMPLLPKAITEKWSMDDVQRAIRIEKGPSTHRGRPRRRPKNAIEAYHDIVQFCDQWQGLEDSLRDVPQGTSEVPPPYRNILAPELRDRLKDAGGQIKRLRIVAVALASEPVSLPTPSEKPKRKLPVFHLPPRPGRAVPKGS